MYIYIYKHYYIYIYHYIPTCELIHPLPKVLVKMNFLCPRCDRWYLIYNLKSVVCFEMCWIFVVSFWRGVLFKSFRGVLKLCVPMIPILPLHSIICRHTSLHVRYLPFPLKNCIHRGLTESPGQWYSRSWRTVWGAWSKGCGFLVVVNY